MVEKIFLVFLSFMLNTTFTSSCFPFRLQPMPWANCIRFYRCSAFQIKKSWLPCAVTHSELYSLIFIFSGFRKTIPVFSHFPGFFHTGKWSCRSSGISHFRTCDQSRQLCLFYDILVNPASVLFAFSTPSVPFLPYIVAFWQWRVPGVPRQTFFSVPGIDRGRHRRRKVPGAPYPGWPQSTRRRHSDSSFPFTAI